MFLLAAPVDPFFDGKALPFDDVERVGTGLSLELELWESDRAVSPLVDDEDSLFDLKFRRSPGPGMVSSARA